MNPINNSGKELENEFEKRLIQYGIPYTKSEEGLKGKSVEELWVYYQSLIDKYIPNESQLMW